MIFDKFANMKYRYGTTVVRAEIPIKNLEEISEDAAIYRVEQTSFFRVSPSGISIFGSDMSIDPSIDFDAFVGSVAAITAVSYCTPPVPTAEPYGNAITSSKTKRSAQRRTSMRAGSVRRSWKLPTA